MVLPVEPYNPVNDGRRFKVAFIKTQKVRTDATGRITAGSAAIVETRYVKDRPGHSQHMVRERLGHVLWLSNDKKSGIFLSPSRGLVEYNVADDHFESVSTTDERLKRSPRLPAPNIHATFGNVYLFARFLQDEGILDVLRAMSPTEELYERLLAHEIHSSLRDGSHIKCDTFIEQSAAAFALTKFSLGTLRCDTRYFEWMGEDNTKVAFFKAYVARMRVKYPAFGKGCYVDSSPLPNDIEGSPYNALRCKNGDCSVQMRLVLVLDEETGWPVWFEIIRGNLLDLHTLQFIRDDVAATLDITIDSFVLDSGYVSRELVQAFPIPEKDSKGDPTGLSSRPHMIARMPDRKGYPYSELYQEFANDIDNPAYDLLRGGHLYFGKRKMIDLFATSIYAYVMVDKNRALLGYQHFMEKHPAQYEKMTLEEKRWRRVEGGYFVLLSNLDETTAAVLQRYLSRVDIEAVFRTGKSFLGLMPLSKWTDQTVRGKILHDVIDTIIRNALQNKLVASKLPVMDIFHNCAATICFRKDDQLRVEEPSRQTKEAYALFEYEIPSQISMADWRKCLGVVA